MAWLSKAFISILSPDFKTSLLILRYLPVFPEINQFSGAENQPELNSRKYFKNN